MLGTDLPVQLLWGSPVLLSGAPPPCCMRQPEKLIGLALVESNFGLSLGHQKERAGVVYIPPREGTLAFSDRLMNHQLLSVFREKIFLRVLEGSKSFPL